MQFTECIWASETPKHTGNFNEEYVDLKDKSHGKLEEKYILSSSALSSWIK
jgi:hypothetical protein